MAAHKLRLGVVGAGAWAVASHLPVLARRADDVDFVAVSRLGAEPLEHVRRQFGFASASEDYRDVLAAGVDVCVVASPAGLHHEHAKAALLAGAHVLVEKPFTLTVADAWDLVATARAVDRRLLVAFGYNYLPAVDAFRALVAGRGGIGHLEQVAIRMQSCCRELLSEGGAYPEIAGDDIPDPDPATWTDVALSGGGYAQAQLTHALALALLLTDQRGSEAFAQLGTPGAAPVELHAAAALRFDDGAVGSLVGGSSWVGADRSRDVVSVTAIGDRGQWKLDLEHEVAWIFVEGDEREQRLDLAPGSADYDCDGPPNALVDLALGKPVENRSTGELAARTVEILDAVYRSAASRRPEAVVHGDVPDPE